MNSRLLVTLLLALALEGCTSQSADAEETNLDPGLQSVATSLAQAADKGGSGVVRITHRGKLLYENGFGSAACTHSEPVTTDHIFMIGSITKEYTRLLGFVLEEQGVISLDDAVADLLPDFRGPIGRVTVRQLMDHTGGLPDLIDRDGNPVAYTIEYDYEPLSRDELIRRAQQVELLWEPGENEQYSNLGYQMLAAIYEVATGDTYPELLQQHVFEPAGITSTGFWFTDIEDRKFADGCRPGDVRWGNPIDDAMWGDGGPSWNLIGAGGLLSTAEGLNQFFEGIRNNAYFDTDEQLETYKSSRMVFSESRQQRMMGPAGSNGIFNAVAVWLDRDEFNVVLLTNRADHPAEGGLIQEIFRAFPAEHFDGHGE